MSVPILFFFLLFRPPPISTLFPYTTLFRSPVSSDDRPGPWPRGRLGEARTARSAHRRSRRAREPARLELRASLALEGDRKSTRLNSSHQIISYAVFCLKKKKTKIIHSYYIL